MPKQPILEKRIAKLKATIADLETLPPAINDKWKVGMLRYYRQCLAELEAYPIKQKKG